MAPDKKLKKKKGVKGAASPAAAPAASPKVAPAASPKPSPKAAPAGAPGPKTSGKAEPCPPPTPQQREAASKRAISAIKKGLADNPAAQEKGSPFIPTDWAKEFKPFLGGYRKFVERCGAFRVVEGARPNEYTVHLNDGKAGPAGPSWENQMFRAWQRYLHDTPKDQRDYKAFVAMAKRISSEKEGGAKAASAAEPAPAAAEAGTKRKSGAEGSGDAKPPMKKKKGGAK